MTVVENARRVTGTLKAMASLFASSPLLALFVVVALGAAIGAIRIGPLRFGAAGALFVGLIVSALHPEVVSNHMSIVQPMGLAFFVYCVGISAGATFFQNLRKQTNLLALTTIASRGTRTRRSDTPSAIRWVSSAASSSSRSP